MSTQIEETVEQILSAISEDLLINTLIKEVAICGLSGVPKSFKGEHVFYISVYHKNKQLRSRSISNSPKDNNLFSEEIDLEHQKIFEQIIFKKDYNIAHDFPGEFNGKPYLGISIGDTVFIVSNSNKIVVEIFTFIIATFFVTFKALLLIKEYGQIHDLLKLKGHYPYGLSYLKKAHYVAFGQLGGHR